MSIGRHLKLKVCCAALLALAAAEVRASAGEAVVIKLGIDTTKTTKLEADAVLRTNVVAYCHEYIPEHLWKKFFADQRVGDVLLDTGSITRNSQNLEDIKKNMKKLDSLVLRTISRGGRVQLIFQNGMPRWLSSNPQNEADIFAGGSSKGEKIWHNSPPSDYGKWQEIARAFVQHFNRELDTKGRVYYIVGNEPENYWVGSEKQFHRYYKHFVKGALEADPKAKVGGITANLSAGAFTKCNPRKQANGKIQFQRQVSKDGKPLLYNWLKFAAKQKLPVNFVTWHDYPAPSPVPGRTAHWVVWEKQIRRWLSEFGYSDVELMLNDWPEWQAVPYENDSEFQAAYVASSLISMIENSKVKALYLGLRDIAAYTKREQLRENASFGGGNGLFTGIGIAKPAYNMFALLSKMRGRIVFAPTGDEFVRALATVDDGAVYVLLVNFIPSRRIIRYNTFGNELKWLDEGQRTALKNKLKSIVKSKGLSPRQLEVALLENRVDVNSLGLPPRIVKKIKGIQGVYRQTRKRDKQVARVKVRLSGLRPGGGRWTCDQYVIDKTHANSYSARKDMLSRFKALGLKLGSKADKARLRKFIEEMNVRTGVDAGRVRKERISIPESTHETTVTLEPNSVHLLILRRSDAGLKR